MDNEKNLRILSINPFALAQMDNPTDEMKLTALRKTVWCCSSSKSDA